MRTILACLLPLAAVVGLATGQQPVSTRYTDATPTGEAKKADTRRKKPDTRRIRSRGEEAQTQNPFDPALDKRRQSEEMMMEMEDYGMEAMGMDEGAGGAGGMEMDMGGGYADMGGMGGMGGMMGGMSAGPSAAEQAESSFQRGLQRAIIALGKASSEKERETLREFVRQALDQRYRKMISQRQKELDRLTESVARLKSELKRREHAKDRVVEVQMQSVQLAAEGLLHLGELQGGNQPEAGGGEGGGYGGDSYGELGGYGGGR